MTKATTALMAATLLASSFFNSAGAQDMTGGSKTQGQPKTMVNQQGQHQRVLVDPGFQQPAPKLGFNGQMIYNYGMKVVSVNWGSAAQRAGLESGDIIVKINGQPIRSQWDYNQALRNAANYNFGRVHMKVRNVRYDWGYNVPMYAFVQTTLDGFGSPVGPIGPQGPVGPRAQARSVAKASPMTGANGR